MGTASSGNRRRHPRFVCRIPAKASGVGSARIVNLSRGGCRLAVSRMLPVGTRITLRVNFPDRFFTVRLKAQVVHASGDQLGLSFVKVSPRQQKILAAEVAALDPADTTEPEPAAA